MIRFASSVAVALLLLIGNACTAPDEVRDVTESEEALESLPPAGEIPDDDTGPEPLDVVEAEVVLTDASIQMSEVLPAAFTRLRIRNEGSTEHRFRMTGPGLEPELAATVAPGEETVLEADLERGTFQVTCPLSDHADNGMRREVTVGLPESPSPPAAPR